MERQLLSPHSALACDIFDQFCNASTLKSIMVLHRRLCDTLNLHSTIFPTFYPEIKGKLYSWRAQELWTSIDKRASHKCYANGTACTGTKVLIIGAGPCGLRTAIEAQLLGAKVIVVEKRDELSRNNVIHLWQFVIQDLRSLGAKKFFGKFCAGSIDHISIRQLQLILCKIALMIGVEVHIGVNFKSLIPPPEDQEKRVGWRAELSPADHAICQYEFDVIIGADGRKQTLEGFGCKEFRGKLAIAITANFINRHTDAEARVEEISGVSFVFNQKFFKELYQNTGVDLENIAYYKDDTHYFVMTAKKPSLIKKGVIKTDPADTARLLSPGNVNQEALRQFAREAADFATKYQLPAMEFAVNHHGQPDVAMFDFTSMSAAENATKIIERRGHRLLTMLVGDSLLESFWPTGSGCARGFLSSLDACWAIRAWGSGTVTPLEVAAERESTYRLLAQTTPDNLSKDFNSYTLEPHTRYPILNLQSVLPMDVKHLIDTDNDTVLLEKSTATEFVPVKRRRKESHVHPGVELLPNKKVAVYDAIVNQADKALVAFPAPNTMEVIAVTPNTEEEVQHCSTAIGDRTLTDKHDVLNASTEDIAVTSSLELARRPSIEIVYCTPTTPVLQQKCKPFIEQEGKCEAEPHGGATAQSAPQKAAEQHGSTEDSNPTLKQTVQCKTNNVSGSITTMKKGVKRGSIEVIEVTPTLQQVEKPPSVNGPLVDADCCEGAQSLQLQKELENKMPRIEVTPAMQPNPPSSPRSPPVTNNLSPNHFWTPPAPSHPPQVYHSSGGQSLTPPAIHSPFSFSPPSPAYSYPSSTYSQPPNFLPPPYPHPQTPLYYPYQQYDTHPQQSQHPQPQHPHANWGQLPEQPNRQHEKIPVVYQFEKVEGATFIVSNNQTSPNVSPGAKQLEQPKTMAQPLGHSEERVGQAKHIIVLETDKGMNDSTLYGLSSHIINILMSSRPGCKEMSSDLADLHVLGHMDSVKFFVEVKNFRGANKVLQLNGSDVFGVTLRAYLTDKVDEEAVSVVPLP